MSLEINKKEMKKIIINCDAMNSVDIFVKVRRYCTL